MFGGATIALALAAAVQAGPSPSGPPAAESPAPDAAPADAAPDAPERRDALDWLGLRLSARAGAWSHDRDLNDEEVVPMAGLRARIAPRLGAFDGFAEGYVQADRVNGTYGDLVEGWLRLTLGAAELRAGRQVVVWGLSLIHI